MIALPLPEHRGFLAPPQAPDELGRLGPYRILEVLGSGGMGVVFRAEDVQLRRPVALKVLLPPLAGCPAARERFFHEARSAAAVGHDHVVPIWQVGKDCGVPFIAMPLLQGESLERRLDREGRLSTAEVLRIGRQTACGLAAAHARGLVHCDVKPANIWLEEPPHPQPLSPEAGERGERRSPLSPKGKGAGSLSSSLSPNGSPSSPHSPKGRGVGSPSSPLSPWGRGVGGEGERVKILDFGLARAAGEKPPLSQEGTVAGTPSYMAPEQSRGGDVDGRTDLFGLGCVLYRMATGELPFRGTDSISTLIVAGVDQPIPPSDLNPDLPPALSALVMRLLAKDPAERLPSAGEAARELEAIERDAAAGSSGDGTRGRPVRLLWSSLVSAAAVLLLVCGHTASRIGPAPAPAGPGPEPRPRIVPAAYGREGARGERRTEAGDPEPPAPAPRQVEPDSVFRGLEQQRDAVGLEVLAAQAELEALDARLRARPVPSNPRAVEADGEVQELRTRVAEARAVLDAYRARGLDLRRPTPQAAARTLADLQARLARRLRQIEEDLRSAGEGREALRQARAQLASRIEALRRVHATMQADLDRLNAIKRDR